MSTISVNSGPHKNLSFIGHADADAFDKQAGKVGACVEEADYNLCYRSTLPEFHDKAFPILLKSGVKREVNAKATATAKEKAKDASKVEDILEGYITYANRVKAGVDEATWEGLDKEVHTLAAGMEVDASPTARQKGPDKGSLAKAEDILGRGKEGIDATIAKLEAVVPEFPLDRDADGTPEKNSLARMIMAWQQASL